MERPNAWKNYNKTELKKVEETAKEYKAFIDAGKTERECAELAVAALEKAGYISLEKYSRHISGLIDTCRFPLCHFL